MTRRKCKRSVLSPTCHPSVNELLVASQAGLRPKPEALEDTWSETLDQGIRLGDEIQDQVDSFWVLEVN
jgi:hypothetical protein